MMSACTLASRARLIRSFRRRTVANRGKPWGEENGLYFRSKILSFQIGILLASIEHLEIVEEVLLLGLEELPVGDALEGLVPEAAHVDAGDLGVLQDPGQAPHQRAVHSQHQH